MRPTSALSLSLKSGSTTIADPLLYQVEAVSFDTFYPGGLYGAASFFVPSPVTAPLLVAPYQTIKLLSGLATVYEGVVTGVEMVVDDARQGYTVRCVGYWGNTLQLRLINKPWADTRLDDATWVYNTALTHAQKCTYDRDNRLYLEPKAVAWSSGGGVYFAYTAPTGQTVKRVTFSYGLQEAAQAWEAYLYNPATAADVWSVAASGTGTVDHTLATPSQSLYLGLRSKAAQTGINDGTIYAKYTAVTVYTETGSINPTEIIKDARAVVTELSADESLIGSNTLSAVPFIALPKSVDVILSELAALGDASNNAWAAGVRASDLASDGKPILFYEQQPALTDYDYAVRWDDANLVPPAAAAQRLDALYNYVWVRYRDENGREVIKSPADDATLTDSASVSAYGQRDYLLDVDTTSSANAIAAGVKFLAQHKSPEWSAVDYPITVIGYIRAKSGAQIPAAEIQAGKRLKIENFLSDLSGTGLTLLISQTRYSEDEGGAQICQLTVGQLDNIEARIA